MKGFYEKRYISDIKDLLYSSEKLYPNNIAFRHRKNSGDPYIDVTFTQLKRDVDSLGTALISLGLKDMPVAVMGENRYEWNISYLAVVCGTGTVVPIDKELPENEIINLLERSKAKAILYSGKKDKEMEAAVSRCENVQYFINFDLSEDNGKKLSFTKLLNEGYRLTEQGDRSFIDAKIDPKAPLIMLFTSGTTSSSKAVLLSHYNIVSNIMNMCKIIYANDSDVFLSVLPLHHTYECTCNFLTPIYLGCKIVISDGLRHIAKNMQENGITVLITVPLLLETVYWKIISNIEKKGKMGVFKTATAVNGILLKLGINVSNKLFKDIYEAMGGKLRLVIAGAAALDPIVAKGFSNMGIRCIQGYGLTECSPIATVETDQMRAIGSVGVPMPGTEIVIKDQNDEGIGEICIKSPSIMVGYLDEKDNAKAFDEEGYFRTGDLGYMDKKGFLYISGRKKNVIVTKNGKNIFPEELEALINASPLVKESLVYGAMDEITGDEIVSVKIVPDHDYIEANYPNGLSEQELTEMINNEIKKVNKSVVHYKAIKKVYIQHKEFQKTTTHKIKRYLET
jgi:long-chain acyl-CoA synthetase